MREESDCSEKDERKSRKGGGEHEENVKREESKLVGVVWVSCE